MLSDIIDEYFKQEIINDFKCEKCGKTGEIIKTQEVLKYPQVLIINVKRFVFSPQSMKLDNEVGIENEIDLSHHFTDGRYDTDASDRELLDIERFKGKFLLRSFIAHIGKLEYGHYMAHCREGDGQKWHTLNDQNVSVSQREQIFEAGAATVYAMFYERVN